MGLGWDGLLLSDGAAIPGLRGTCPEGGGWEQAPARSSVCPAAWAVLLEAAEPAKSRRSAGWIAAGRLFQRCLGNSRRHNDCTHETFWKCRHGAVQQKCCANAAVLLLSGL